MKISFGIRFAISVIKIEQTLTVNVNNYRYMTA